MKKCNGVVFGLLSLGFVVFAKQARSDTTSTNNPGQIGSTL